MPSFFIFRHVISMCVESSECTKLGGKAERCLRTETGKLSLSMVRVMFCSTVFTMCEAGLRYGWITGSPRGVTHAMVWPCYYTKKYAEILLT